MTLGCCSRPLPSLLVFGFVAARLAAQLNLGSIEVNLRRADGRPLALEPIAFEGGAGFRAVTRTNSQGQVSIALPYGHYRLFAGNSRDSAVSITVAPLGSARFEFIVEESDAIRALEIPLFPPQKWAEATAGHIYPVPASLPGLLLYHEPSSVTQPLALADITNDRLVFVSQRGITWTDVQYKLHGMDAADSYEPGLPAVLPDVEAAQEFTVRSGLSQSKSSSYGTEIGLFLEEPRRTWHGGLSTVDTGSALSSSNLWPPAGLGIVRQPARFRWFTRDRVETGGPISKRADLYMSGTGEWSSQTEPLTTASDQGSRVLFGNARGRFAPKERDQLDSVYSGSRIDLSDGGVPASIRALTGNRMAPSFTLPGGFAGSDEVDHMDFLQAGWTHVSAPQSRIGIFELRYGYSVAHLDTSTPKNGQSRIELLGGIVTGAPPLANEAVRTRNGIEVAWQPSILRASSIRHQFAIGGGWKNSDARNRFAAPSQMNLITAAGAPAFVTEFNTPVDPKARIRSLDTHFADRIVIRRSLTLDVGALADFSRGSLPEQSSPAGLFVDERRFPARTDLIRWNSISPRAGFAWQVPHASGLALQGSYFRLYSPLAGRYLDFANPNSLGGSMFRWTAPTPAGAFEPSQIGPLVLRFGGPYSSISPELRRPYADEFDIGAEIPIVGQVFGRVQLFRRDSKNRIAALNTGVPDGAFIPVVIHDPGPDGINGTFDDRQLTVYAQNPATFGQDRYLLTNPAGLRTLNTGLVAEAGVHWSRLTLNASFVAEKSYGPTNPGNAVYENDPSSIGALFMDPNTTVNSQGRSFVDRAYIGKIQAAYRLPPKGGGIEVASVVLYTDGLPFARRLLVTGLPQGPFLVAATARGSPEGGNRTQYALSWNLRVSRNLEAARGKFGVSADIFNVTNARQNLQENDLSGPLFNERLPVAIQPARYIRFGVQYEF